LGRGAFPEPVRGDGRFLTQSRETRRAEGVIIINIPAHARHKVMEWMAIKGKDKIMAQNEIVRKKIGAHLK